MNRTLKRMIIIVAVCSSAGIFSLFIPLEKELFRKENIHSLKVLDRNGKVLREFLNDAEGRGEWVALSDISSSLLNATITIEDKRFFSHPGIDPRAIVRAFASQFLPGRRSGGSTITQQVIRNVYRHPRTFFHKMIEAWYALRLERMMSKEEILEQYCNRAPYGNQLTGIQAASKYYFDKPAKNLSIAEAAFLAALPNAPSQLNPRRNHALAVQRQRKIIRQLLTDRLIAPDLFQRALDQRIPIVTPSAKFKAPHAVDLITAGLKGQHGIASVQSTIDSELQNEIQWIMTGHLSQLQKKNVTNASVVVIHNATGEIRSLVGSADYFDDRNNGQVNGAVALRQPGSAVKPLTYAIGLESGYTAASILPDIPTALPNEGGNYVPQNYDREYHGPVRLRVALACSYNIPAARLLFMVGKEALYHRMQAAGITSLTHSPNHYGFGLTLGNAEVTLLELTNAYRLFANNGMWNPVRLVQSILRVDKSINPSRLSLEKGHPHIVFDSVVSYLITDILKDNGARRPAFGNHFHFSFPCAVKTGTTKDFRDNWTIGYSTEYTVGVWVGNFNGTPMHQVSGVTGAGQIFADIMNSMMTNDKAADQEFKAPAGMVRKQVCAKSGNIPTEYCPKTIDELFSPYTHALQTCEMHKPYVIRDRSGEMRTEVFEVFPDVYKEWCASEGIPGPPAGAVEQKNAVGQHIDRDMIKIIYPRTGDVFKIDPVLRREYQSIKVESSMKKNMDNAALIIDGKEKVPVTGNGAWWSLQRGKHSFVFEGVKNGKKIKSDKIEIIVE